jgi:hypothetical protein
MLKRKLAGVVAAGLLLGAGAVNADEGSTPLPAQSTYADQYRGKPVQSTGSPFPVSHGRQYMPPQSTYADQYRGKLVQSTGSPFPVSHGRQVMPPQSTYADRYRGTQRAESHADMGAAGSAFPSSNATD